MSISKQDALDFHRTGRKGKLEVVPSKPCATARDLSLAYTPGVAEPCLEIEKDNETSKDNLLRLQNNRRMNMKRFGMQWYGLKLEKPPAALRPGHPPGLRKGFRVPKQNRHKS